MASAGITFLLEAHDTDGINGHILHGLLRDIAAARPKHAELSRSWVHLNPAYGRFSNVERPPRIPKGQWDEDPVWQYWGQTQVQGSKGAGKTPNTWGRGLTMARGNGYGQSTHRQNAQQEAAFREHRRERQNADTRVSRSAYSRNINRPTREQRAAAQASRTAKSAPKPAATLGSSEGKPQQQSRGRQSAPTRQLHPHLHSRDVVGTPTKAMSLPGTWFPLPRRLRQGSGNVMPRRHLERTWLPLPKDEEADHDPTSSPSSRSPAVGAVTAEITPCDTQAVLGPG